MPVQALLPKLVALALALALVPVAVRRVPPRIVLVIGHSIDLKLSPD